MRNYLLTIMTLLLASGTVLAKKNCTDQPKVGTK